MTDVDIDDMDELLLKAYEHIVSAGRWDGEWLSEVTGAPLKKVKEAHRVLVDLRVIETDQGRDGWRAVSPRLAMAKLVLPIDAEIRRRAVYADNLREQLQMLVPAYEAKRRAESLDAVQVITERAELTKLIEDEIGRCDTELAVMQGKADETLITEAWYLNARSRGARIRTVYPHSARYHAPTEGLVASLDATRLEFRTAGELPVHLLMFDRSACVLVPPRTTDDEPDGPPTVDESGVAVVLRHPFVMSLMAGVFEEVWSRSSPLLPMEPQPAWIGDEQRRTILRLLSTGAKDDAVARRLGISIRTCRRYVSDVMSALGASSRFQAGVEAIRRGMI